MLTIIGCGNPNRSDDGVGVVVARRLLERLEAKPRDGVRVFDAGTDGMSVMFAARGASALIIVDAGKTGVEPGAIYEVPGEELEGEPPASHTLHDFRWDHALYAGRRIFKEAFPTDVTVYLIESETLDLGLELSSPVAAAADRVVGEIERRMAAYAEARS